MTAIWRTARYAIDLACPRVMGIVNVTPDSFSDGGVHGSTRDAIKACERLVAEGADLLDIGGESTRPGSPGVSLQEELSRVLPVLVEAVKLGVPISIDTYKPEVMRAALDLGVDIVNDVWALRQPGAREVVASHPACGVSLMHMHRDPLTMQASPMEGDVIPAVLAFWTAQVESLRALQVAPSRLLLDPGIGFGKTVAQNFALLARQRELLTAGFPLLCGWSRKSSLGAITGIDAARERVLPSVVAAVLAVERGASVVRVHDVRETATALAVWRASQAA